MITLSDIHAARERISSIVLHTPVITDPIGSGLRIKAEHLQRTGSFKLRGATNCVTRAVEAGARSVVTASSGNHGQAVAYVAQRLGVKCTVVVPEDVMAVKVEGIRSYGGQVEYCGRTSSARISRAEEIARTEGAVYIPPYDHVDVMAGQGTAGLEIIEQAPDAEVVFIPVGGGGLLSGAATAIKELNPKIKVFGVEPELASDTYQSMQKGALVTIGPTDTVADGLRSSQPGTLTFPVVQRYVDGIVLVSEQEIRDAFRFMFSKMRQLVEPSGAVSVAAALRHGGKAVALVSGGNVERTALPGLLGL